MHEIFDEGYEYGGAGVDIAGPNSGYQWLHSDDNRSKPFSGDEDIRNRFWVPSMLLAHPVLEQWNNRNGPLRIVPWTAHSVRQYKDICNHGLDYDTEKQWDLLNSWIPAERGDVIIRDVRALHGGTPNKTEHPRIMISLAFYNSEAVKKYPSIYVPYEESAASLPRFHKFDKEDAMKTHYHNVERYGEMKTL